MISKSLKLIMVGFSTLPPLALATPKLVTTTTDLAWMAREIAGTDAEVESLLKGTEDPHFVDARPDYIRKVASADAVCVVGLDLEVGWMPKVLAKSGRAALQPGGKGYCDTGSRIDVLEKPTGPIDRSMGDVHPSGNPHFWLSPSAMAQSSEEVADTLARIDPGKAQAYRERQKAFVTRMNELQTAGRARLVKAGVSGSKARFLEYHREFAYFAQAFGLESLGSLEEKPGVSPSAGRLVNVASQAKSEGVRIVLATEHSPRRLLARFEELSGVPVQTVPVSIDARGEPKDYPALLSRIEEAIVAAATGKGRTAK
jgi:zinc/manganese transport system substrate-binding protein